MRSLLIALFTIISVQNTYSQSDQTLLGNVRDGYGIWLYKNLGIYEGVWKDNEKSGRGQIIYPDGQRYAGNYRNDVKFGPGVLLCLAVHAIPAIGMTRIATAGVKWQPPTEQ